MKASILGLFVSQGGVPKLPVDSLFIEQTGCFGDKQNDLKHHGGEDKAVCLIQNSIISSLQQDGHPIKPGSTGENILIGGSEVGEISPGTIIKFNELEIEITQDAPPCKTISQSFNGGEFTLISHKKYPQFTRWYARVLKPGTVSYDEEYEIIN
ncbi:MAG: MOSC domain-containing protein [Candidatus Poseidoniales archaeon]|nr:MAG: MOSC domain-containing protein [Candidatus Poseidoniales archaeon]